MKLVLIKTTTESLSDAKKLSEQLIAQKLAACVSIGTPILSHYVWQNQTHWSDEYPILIKTNEIKQSSVLNFLKHHHPYDTPEINCILVDDTNTDYLQWVNDTLS